MSVTNRFYNYLASLSLGQLALPAQPETQYRLIQAGFDMIETEMDALQGITGITSLVGFPASFDGAADQYLVVNSAANAVEFRSGGRLTIKVVTGTSYTLLASDAGKLLIFTNASAITVTVPPDTLAQGDVVCIRQGNTGQVTLSAGAGVTFASSDNLLSTRTQSAQIAVIADGANQFGVIGERDAPSLGVALLAQANVFTKAQTVTPVALTDAATIATDASLSNTFTVTLGGNRTMGNPTNLVNGTIYTWHITQDGTGSRTLSWASLFKFAGGSAPTLTTTAGKTDIITGQYLSGPNVIRMGALLKGYD